MADELLGQLRAEVERATGLSQEAKARLLGHVEVLEQHASEGVIDKARARLGLERLSSLVEELEASHPAITNIVGRIAVALGNMGI
jgi:hypothetical protein